MNWIDIIGLIGKELKNSIEYLNSIVMNNSPTLITTCYFDRNPKSIEGLFTIRTVDETGKVVKEFAKLPARSGQVGYTDTSWIRGKSPIPFTQESKDLIVLKNPNQFPKNLWLWLKNVLQVGEWAGMKGIGEFRYISSSKTDPNIIQSPENPSLVRHDIGLHPDQITPRLKGSAGCIVLACDTEEQKTRLLVAREYLNELAKTQKHIKLVVL